MQPITRTVDHLGRIVIPKHLRDKLKLSEGDSIVIDSEGDTVTVRRARAACKLCGREEGILREFGICAACAARIQNAPPVTP